MDASSDQLPVYKTNGATVWKLEKPDGTNYAIIHNLITGVWIIDEEWYDEELGDWEGKELHRGGSKEVFDLMKECGVKFLAS